MVLEGNFGCLVDGDFEIVVQDGNTANGNIVDGCGDFIYEISLATPQPIVGFTGPFAPGNWNYIIENGGSIVFTGGNTGVTITGPDGGFCATCEASMGITMPGDGTISFDYDWTNLDIAFGPFFDAFIALVDLSGNIVVLANTDGQVSGSGSVSQAVSAGDLFIMGVVSDDGIFGPGIAEISNFGFDSMHSKALIQATSQPAGDTSTLRTKQIRSSSVHQTQMRQKLSKSTKRSQDHWMLLMTHSNQDYTLVG